MQAVSVLGSRVRAALAWPPALWVLLAIGAAAAVVLVVAPQLDLYVAKAFFGSGDTFVGQDVRWLKVLRHAFIAFYLACITLALVGILVSRWTGRAWLRWRASQWLFLAICLVVGPGLVANTVLKDNWGRARPTQVVEFGGEKTFTPALFPSRQCPKNCSFVTGEAASIFVLFYAAAALIPQSAVLLAAVGTVLGLLAGMVRMAQGAHFLSDVIFAGVFMALTVLVVWNVMFGRLGCSVARWWSARSAPGKPSATP
jgi:lipid A 4'-phosphatase